MTPVSAPPEPISSSTPPVFPEKRRRFRFLKTASIWCVSLAILAAAIFFGIRAYRSLAGTSEDAVPTAKVQRGDISLSITARGELRGGNSESLVAPMTGGSELHITSLTQTGTAVKSGDVLVQFDTTEQQYKLKEAEADLAEANQHLIQARAQRDAEKEEDSYALLKGQSDVKLAELDVRKNPLVAAIAAKQNDLALASARDHLSQVEQNLANRKATGEAGIAMQQAAKAKAEEQAKTARQNIEMMTLHAKRSGYVSVRQNSSQNFMFDGMVLPLYQVGDAVHPGVEVAQIPDLKNWELSANIGELDRGHLAVGDKVSITVIAVPGRLFHGSVKDLGGTTGMFWDRHFECKIGLDDPSPKLRPGMSASIVVATDEMHRVLWIPAQAIFESDGRTLVYARSGSSFKPRNITLVRRNETRAVISGLREGQLVALANPLDFTKKKSADASPLKSVGR